MSLAHGDETLESSEQEAASVYGSMGNASMLPHLRVSWLAIGAPSPFHEVTCENHTIALHASRECSSLETRLRV